MSEIVFNITFLGQEVRNGLIVTPESFLSQHGCQYELVQQHQRLSLGTQLSKCFPHVNDLGSLTHSEPKDLLVCILYSLLLLAIHISIYHKP